MKNRSIIHEGGRAISVKLPPQDLLNFWQKDISDTTAIASVIYFIGVHEGWKNIMELGSGKGYTARSFSEIIKHNGGKFLSVDFLKETANVIPKQENVYHFVSDTSNSKAIREKLDEIEMNELDCLFIDADHTKNAVKRDFENYKDLVRKEGMILFHDVCVLDRECEVPLWWIDAEFPGYEKMTFSFNNGLGILRKID